MQGVHQTSELLAAGYSANELTRLRRSGALGHVRRGAYANPLAELSAAERHRLLIAATMPRVAEGAVISHQSAAVLHHLPLLSPPLAQVQLTRTDIGSGKRRGLLHLHAAPLADTEICLLGGLRVTSPARTVVDLARTLPLADAVAAGDAALRVGLAAEDLDISLGLAAGRPGIARARRARGLLDGRSESVGESCSRVLMQEQGVPAPEPQFQVYDHTGAMVARCDFGWVEQGLLGEFDGKVKYGALLRPGQRPEDVVFREKRREDALRELGWMVIRWCWSDLQRPEVLAARLRRALARAAPAAPLLRARAAPAAPLLRRLGCARCRGRSRGGNTAGVQERQRGGRDLVGADLRQPGRAAPQHPVRTIGGRAPLDRGGGSEDHHRGGGVGRGQVGDAGVPAHHQGGIGHQGGEGGQVEPADQRGGVGKAGGLPHRTGQGRLALGPGDHDAVPAIGQAPRHRPEPFRRPAPGRIGGAGVHHHRAGGRAGLRGPGQPQVTGIGAHPRPGEQLAPALHLVHLVRPGGPGQIREIGVRVGQHGGGPGGYQVGDALGAAPVEVDRQVGGRVERAQLPQSGGGLQPIHRPGER